MRSLVVVGLVASFLGRPAHADDGDRWDGTTMVVQAGGGIAGGLLGGAGLGLTGALLGSALGRSGDWGAPLAGGAIGVVLGGLTGVIVGVQLTGDARDGTGRWWGTLGGAAVGTGGVVALAWATERARGFHVPKAAAFVVLILGTSIVGYHLSGEAHAPMAVPLTLRF